MFSVTVEYCPECNWLARAAWVAQELLQTFRQELNLGVALVPSSVAGRFDVTLNESSVPHRVWSRKVDGFPDIKSIKQRIRDHVNGERSLGHTDR